jgi:type VI secretion system secreted protein VgrG
MVAAAADTSHGLALEFEIEGVSKPLRVVRIAGTEGLSELFHFNITLASAEARPSALKDIAGSKATLTLIGGGTERHLRGIVSQFRQGASGARHLVYHAVLVPSVYALVHRVDARIFQEKSVPDIVKKVLEDAGLGGADYQLALEKSYEPREYCVQYCESDWAFISRLLEEEGIYYFFEHGDSATKLVIADAPSAHESIADPSTVPFRPPTAAMASVEAVLRLEAVEEMCSGKVTLRDYNFEKPSLSLEKSAAGSRHGDLEVFDYPGGYVAPGEGGRYAKLRLEERQAPATTIEGETSVVRFAAGHAFTLDDHPIAELNAEYVITSVLHEGSQPVGAEAGAGSGPAYSARFTAIPRKVPYRPVRLTKKPTIHVQTAIVVGPSGEEIYTDKHGRVKVQFHWDRLGKSDENSSTWLRVSNAWAGTGWGAIYIPRVGQEVVVDFLDGDPDRPLVVGRVYHGTNVPPYALPDNKTRSTLKSMSSPSGDAGNELRFEDKKDSEEVFLHAQKDLVVAVENDRKETIGNDDTRDITNNRTTTIGKEESLTVSGGSKWEITKDHELTVGGSIKIKADTDWEEAITGKKTIEVQGEKLEITCGPSKIKVTQSGIEIESPEIKVKGTTSATIQGEAKVDIKASGQVGVKADGMVKVEASGMVQVKGAMVQVN